MGKPGTNEFFDINKLPKEPGITYFCISMPLLSTRQSPRKCYDLDQHLISKIQVSNVGAQIVYTDGLYLYNNAPAVELKLKHQKLIEEHKQSWLALIKQDITIIPSAFTFMTWTQLLLECPKFSTFLVSFRKIYDQGKLLQEYVEQDILGSGREVNPCSVGYILEEILVDYLVVKGRVRLPNEYTKDREQWILNCYHGKPHRAHVYLHQQNFFDLHNPKNQFQNSWYDALNNKLYDFDRLDIGSFDFSKPA